MNNNVNIPVLFIAFMIGETLRFQRNRNNSETWVRIPSGKGLIINNFLNRLAPIAVRQLHHPIVRSRHAA